MTATTIDVLKDSVIAFNFPEIGLRSTRASLTDIGSSSSGKTLNTEPMPSHVLYFDGGARGNPGPGGAGACIKRDGVVMWEGYFFMGTTTNNMAEYNGLVRGLTSAANAEIDALTVYGDSKLVIEQMQGNWKVKSPNLKPYHEEAMTLSRRFAEISFAHVRREQNPLNPLTSSKMRRFHLVVLFGCLLLSSSLLPTGAEEDEYEEVEEDAQEVKEETGPDDKDVFVLTDANFDDKISKAKFALVEFYAPWCGHCKNLAPHYAKAATTLKDFDASILIAKVDATENKKVAEKYGVQGYPTLKWFIDGKDTEYTGGREEDSIVQWVKKKVGPPSTIIKTVEELKGIEKENEVYIHGYFSSFEGKEFDAFIGAARVAEDVTYTQTLSKEVAAAAGVKGDKTPSIIIVKNFDGYEREVVEFTKTATIGNLEEFIVAEKLPLVIPFNEKNQGKIFDGGIDTHVLCVNKAEALKSDHSFFKALLAVAAKFKGKLMFVSVDIDEKSSSEPVLNFFGVDKNDAPFIFGFQMANNRKFKYAGDHTEAKLTAWCQDLIDGKAEATYKSQEPPENDVVDNVKIIVGKTVDTVVKDPTKDVLLEVYAPWCGHCKQLEPTYKKLGKRFSTIDSVIIAKMDGTENEHKDIEVSGFPALFFFPAAEGAEKIAYEEGDRSLLSLTKFIKKHAKIPYELPTKKKSKGDEPASDEDAEGEEEEKKTEL